MSAKIVFQFFFVLFIRETFCGRILFVPPMISGSHKLSLVPWAESLSDRGHEIYWWAPGVALDKYQPKKAKKVDHFVFDFDMTELMEQYKEDVWTNLYTKPYFITSLTLQLTPMCETVMVNFNESFRDVLSVDYDLIIMDEIMNPCGYLIAHLTKAPVILVSSTCRLTRQTVIFNNIPSPYSYSGCIGDRRISSDKLTFIQRFQNTYAWISSQIADQIFYAKMTNRLKVYYPNLTDIRSAVIRPSFQFVAMALMLDFPGPFQRNLIYVGGLNMYMDQAKSDQLDSLLNSLPNGFILMAMGHWGNWDTAPAQLRETFVKAFNLIPKNYTIIWQYKGPALSDLNDNVKLLQWIPQRKLLAHEKCKLFITHCGCNSLSEAVHYGIPIVALPLAFDQPDGAARMVSRGLGTMVRKDNITVENLFKSIMDVLQNKSYEERIKKFSEQSADVIISPLEKAVFWTEFAVRHQNAYQISSVSFEQSIFAYYNFDIISVFLIIVACFTLII